MVTHWYFQKYVFDWGDRTWTRIDQGMFPAGDPIAFDTIWAHFANGANRFDRVSFAWEWDSGARKWTQIQSA